MQVELNGERRELGQTQTLAQLIDELQLGGRRIAVEINEEIVPRSDYASHRLQPGDRIEIVHAIGGG